MVELLQSYKPVAYEEALAAMEARVEAIRAGHADECLWLLEHPPLYTAGTSAKDSDLIDACFPVYKTGRGGQYTYHGPGQRVGYVMLDLKERQSQPDIRKYVWQLEEWLIRTLAAFAIKGERREGRVGIWVRDDASESKIAAIGVRVRRWVTYHGVAVNLDPDLSHFNGIVPCGVSQYGVTAINKIAKQPVSIAELDTALCDAFSAVFGMDVAMAGTVPQSAAIGV